MKIMLTLVSSLMALPGLIWLVVGLAFIGLTIIKLRRSHSRPHRSSQAIVRHYGRQSW